MVKAWKEKVVIPTYEVGKPEKNPIFRLSILTSICSFIAQMSAMVSLPFFLH